MEYPDDCRRYPDELIEYPGAGFIFGGIYGSTHHLIKGFYNSTKGQRLVGAYQAVRLNAPRVSSRFAARFGVLGVFDALLYYACDQKDNPRNFVVAGAATGGFLKLRHGVRAASRSGVIGGAALAVIEGLGILLERYPPDYVEGEGFVVKKHEATRSSK